MMIMMHHHHLMMMMIVTTSFVDNAVGKLLGGNFQVKTLIIFLKNLFKSPLFLPPCHKKLVGVIIIVVIIILIIRRRWQSAKTVGLQQELVMGTIQTFVKPLLFLSIMHYLVVAVLQPTSEIQINECLHVIDYKLEGTMLP